MYLHEFKANLVYMRVLGQAGLRSETMSSIVFSVFQPSPHILVAFTCEILYLTGIFSTCPMGFLYQPQNKGASK